MKPRIRPITELGLPRLWECCMVDANGVVHGPRGCGFTPEQAYEDWKERVSLAAGHSAALQTEN
jgi:hypothetical protein